MALRFPFRRMASEFTTAAQNARWQSIGALLERNFAEAERWTEIPDSFPNKRVTTVTPTTDRATASASYVSWPTTETLTATFTKRLDSTRIIVTMIGSAFMTGAASTLDYGVSVDGAATTLLKTAGINTLNAHQDQTGTIEIEGLSAGEHTFALKARVTAGGGTLKVNAQDQVSLVVEEVA